MTKQPESATRIVGQLSAVILFVSLLAWLLGACSVAHADEPSPTAAFNVTCKDGHEAHHVLGDIQAPCRRHGGTRGAVIVDDVGASGMIVEPLDTSDSDSDEMHRLATCNDGAEFWSNRKSHSGACKGHNGVKSWDDGTKVKVKRAEHRVPKATLATTKAGNK